MEDMPCKMTVRTEMVEDWEPKAVPWHEAVARNIEVFGDGFKEKDISANYLIYRLGVISQLALWACGRIKVLEKQLEEAGKGAGAEEALPSEDQAEAPDEAE